MTPSSSHAKAAPAARAAAVPTRPVSRASSSVARRICAPEAPIARSRPKERRRSTAEASEGVGDPEDGHADRDRLERAGHGEGPVEDPKRLLRSSRLVEIESAKRPAAAARMRRRRASGVDARAGRARRRS